MGLIDELLDGEDVGLDTDAIIYYVEEHPQFLAVVSPVFEGIINEQFVAHASHMSLIEVLVGPLREGLAELAADYHRRLTNSFVLHDVNQTIAEHAASIRARWNLRTPDAIIAATALQAGCDHFITNDPIFERVEGLNALIVSKFS